MGCPRRDLSLVSRGGAADSETSVPGRRASSVRGGVRRHPCNLAIRSFLLTARVPVVARTPRDPSRSSVGCATAPALGRSRPARGRLPGIGTWRGLLCSPVNDIPSKKAIHTHHLLIPSTRQYRTTQRRRSSVSPAGVGVVENCGAGGVAGASGRSPPPYQPTHQPTNQPTHQPANQTTRWFGGWVGRLVGRLVSCWVSCLVA